MINYGFDLRVIHMSDPTAKEPLQTRESAPAPYKPGQGVMCRIESAEPGGYLATVLGIGGPPLANPENDAAPVLKAFVPSSEPLRIGQIIPATFVCMHGNKALMTFAYMLGTTERVQHSTAPDSENAFAIWVDSYPSSQKLRRAVDIIMPSLSGKLLHELTCKDCDVDALLRDLELAAFTGTLKARSESLKSRSAMLLYRGRVVGAIYGRKDLNEPLDIQKSIALIKGDLKNADTLIQVYELPQNVVLSMSAIFLGCPVTNDGSLDVKDFVDTTLMSMRLSGEMGCITIAHEAQRPDILLFIDRGDLTGGFEIETTTYETERTTLDAHIAAADAALLDVHMLPEQMLSDQMTFGYKLTDGQDRGNTKMITNPTIDYKGESLALETDADGVAILWFDNPGSVNSLSTAVLNELTEVVSLLEKSADRIKIVVMASKKKDQFISGADLHEIMGFKNEGEALKLSSDGQAAFNRLANLKQTTIAAVHGTCLGGGLEAALCADIRLASDHPSTLIGLPEVRLGLIPGLGGTQRLPRLIPVRQAIEFILNSDAVDAHKALEMSIVDRISASNNEDLIEAARKLGREILTGYIFEREPRPAEKPEKLKTVFATMERSIRIRLKGHYPAPIQAIAAVRHAVESPLAAGLAFEAEAFAGLAISRQSSNLIQLFFSHDFIARSAERSATKNGGTIIQNLGIVGSGTMGLDIAKLALHKGLYVTLKTSHAEKIAELHEFFAQHGYPTDKVRVTGDYADLKDCDVVLEAVLEEPALKRQVLGEIERAVSETCVILTNTSSIELLELGQDLQHPERFAGTHFFYPVDKMQLVEVINHPSTNAKSGAKALGLACLLKKVPISVQDSNGFLVNRLLTVLLLEAARMYEEMTPVNWIEDAALAFGLPMGPFNLMDELGADLCFSVARRLHRTLGDRFAPPTSLKAAEDAGIKGKYFGKGFYVWDEKGRKGDLSPEFAGMKYTKVAAEKADAETLEKIQNRLILPMIDEASRCLEEKVVRKPRELDLALTVGTGFPSFTGGPLRYADGMGIGTLIGKLEDVYKHQPAGRECSDLLKAMRDSNRRFYSSGD